MLPKTIQMFEHIFKRDILRSIERKVPALSMMGFFQVLSLLPSLPYVSSRLLVCWQKTKNSLLMIWKLLRPLLPHALILLAIFAHGAVWVHGLTPFRWHGSTTLSGCSVKVSKERVGEILLRHYCCFSKVGQQFEVWTNMVEKLLGWTWLSNSCLLCDSVVNGLLQSPLSQFYPFMDIMTDSSSIMNQISCMFFFKRDQISREI